MRRITEQYPDITGKLSLRPSPQCASPQTALSSGLGSKKNQKSRFYKRKQPHGKQARALAPGRPAKNKQAAVSTLARGLQPGFALRLPQVGLHFFATTWGQRPVGAQKKGTWVGGGAERTAQKRGTWVGGGRAGVKKTKTGNPPPRPESSCQLYQLPATSYQYSHKIPHCLFATAGARAMSQDLRELVRWVCCIFHVLRKRRLVFLDCRCVKNHNVCADMADDSKCSTQMRWI
jgi:hypothetical protein